MPSNINKVMDISERNDSVVDDDSERYDIIECSDPEIETTKVRYLLK